ncbi:hypothetical protein JCM11641_005837 [Rhodosporidiobolus odoratus]
MLTPPSSPNADAPDDASRPSPDPPAPATSARLAERYKDFGRAGSSPPPPPPVKQKVSKPAVKRKKRSTGIRNCQSCRTRKQKCDRLQPCSNCSLRGLTCVYEESSSGPVGLTALEKNHGEIARLRREVNTLARRLELSQPELNKLAQVADRLVQGDRVRAGANPSASKRQFSVLLTDAADGSFAGDHERRVSFSGKHRRLSFDSEEVGDSASRRGSSAGANSPPLSHNGLGSRPTDASLSPPESYRNAYTPYPPPGYRPVHSILYPAHGYPAGTAYQTVLVPYPQYARPPPSHYARHPLLPASAPYDDYSPLPSASPASRADQHSPPHSGPLRLPGFSTSTSRDSLVRSTSASTSASGMSSPASGSAAARSLPPIVIPLTPARRALQSAMTGGTSAAMSGLARPSPWSAAVLSTPASSIAPTSAASCIPPPPLNLVYRLPTPKLDATARGTSLDAFATSRALSTEGKAVSMALDQSKDGISLPPLRLSLNDTPDTADEVAEKKRALPSLSSEMARWEKMEVGEVA